MTRLRTDRRRAVVRAAIITILLAASTGLVTAGTAGATDRVGRSKGGTVSCKPRTQGGFTLGDGIVAVPLRGWCVTSGKDGGAAVALTRENVSMIINVRHRTADTDPRAAVQANYEATVKPSEYIKLQVNGITDETVSGNTLQGARLAWVALAHKDRPKGPITAGAVVAHVRRDGWVLDYLFFFDYGKQFKANAALADSTSRAVFEDFANR